MEAQNTLDSQIVCRMSNSRVIKTRYQITLQSHRNNNKQWNRGPGNKHTQLQPPNFQQAFKTYTGKEAVSLLLGEKKL